MIVDQRDVYRPNPPFPRDRRSVNKHSLYTSFVYYLFLVSEGGTTEVEGSLRECLWTTLTVIILASPCLLPSGFFHLTGSFFPLPDAIMTCLVSHSPLPNEVTWHRARYRFAFNRSFRCLRPSVAAAARRMWDGKERLIWSYCQWDRHNLRKREEREWQ